MLQVGLLGPLVVSVDPEVLTVGAAKERSVLALLALRAGGVVRADELVEALWGDRPPRSALKTVQNYVSALRRLLPAGAIETVASGYRLAVGRDDVDTARFERLVADGVRTAGKGEAEAAVGYLEKALGLWRGRALEDLVDQPLGMAEAARLEEMRRGAEEDLAETGLALGRHDRLVGQLEVLVAKEPLRERRWRLLMLALYRCGRQTDALRAFQRVRAQLGEQLGIDPSAVLRGLEEAILLQKPELDWHETEMDDSGAGRGGGRGLSGVITEMTGNLRRTATPSVLGSLCEHEPSPRREGLRFRLPRSAANFTGREDLLAKLDAALQKGGSVVVTQIISGLGGVGKTQLATAYVNAHADEFDVVAWVRAEEGGTGDLAELAVSLDLPVAGHAPAERAADALRFLSRTRSRWLLVLDNVPGPAALVELPSSGEGRVLVTSRHRGGFESFGPELVVDVFDPGTARRYLLARSGRSGANAEGADEVAAALGYLPLALAHAGAYCTSGSGVRFDEYLELLEELPSQELFGTNPEVFHHGTIAATWSTSIAAALHAPLTVPALEMMAYLAPDAIPRSFFSVLAGDNAAGRKQVADALACLHRYSLATVADTGVTVHRLLQKVIRDHLDESGARAAGHALAAVRAATPSDPQLPALWPRWQELVPHVVALANNDLVARTHTDKVLETINRTYRYLFESASATEAYSLASRGSLIAAGYQHGDDCRALLAGHNLAQSHFELGHTTDAIALQEAVVSGRERVLGPDHLDAIKSRNNLAIFYSVAGRFEEAIAIFEQVVAYRERVLGGDHPQTISARGNLGHALGSGGRVDEAIGVLERVVTDRERVLGSDHIETVRARDNVGCVYRIAGRFDEAIAILEKVVQDADRFLGGDHTLTVDYRHDLAASYCGAGRVEEAVTMLELVVADFRRLLGAGHYLTLESQHELALSYRAAGSIEQSVAVLEQVVADRERVLGSDHHHTVQSKHELARSYHAAGQVSESVLLLELVVAERERALRVDHPETLAARADLERITARSRPATDETPDVSQHVDFRSD